MTTIHMTADLEFPIIHLPPATHATAGQIVRLFDEMMAKLAYSRHEPHMHAIHRALDIMDLESRVHTQ